MTLTTLYIPEKLQGRVQMCKYADDCTALESISNGELLNMQKVLDGLQNWATTSNMLLNRNKTKDVWILFCKNSIKPDPLRINDSIIVWRGYQVTGNMATG